MAFFKRFNNFTQYITCLNIQLSAVSIKGPVKVKRAFDRQFIGDFLSKRTQKIL